MLHPQARTDTAVNKLQGANDRLYAVAGCKSSGVAAFTCKGCNAHLHVLLEMLQLSAAALQLGLPVGKRLFALADLAQSLRLKALLPLLQLLLMRFQLLGTLLCQNKVLHLAVLIAQEVSRKTSTMYSKGNGMPA